MNEWALPHLSVEEAEGSTTSDHHTASKQTARLGLQSRHSDSTLRVFDACPGHSPHSEGLDRQLQPSLPASTALQGDAQTPPSTTGPAPDSVSDRVPKAHQGLAGAHLTISPLENGGGLPTSTTSRKGQMAAQNRKKPLSHTAVGPAPSPHSDFLWLQGLWKASPRDGS